MSTGQKEHEGHVGELVRGFSFDTIGASADEGRAGCVKMVYAEAWSVCVFLASLEHLATVECTPIAQFLSEGWAQR